MIRSTTTAVREVVLSSTLIGPFEFERVRSDSNGPVRVEDETT